MEDRFQLLYITNLFFTHLKRHSFIKASLLYEQIERNFLEYIEGLDKIRDELNISKKDLEKAKPKMKIKRKSSFLKSTSQNYI